MTSRPRIKPPPTDAELGGVHTLRDGSRVRLAPLASGDRQDLLDGFAGLSRQSRYLRFFSAMPVLSETILTGLLATDGVRHYAVCARRVADDGSVLPAIVGVARYFRDAADPAVAEPAVAVVDDLHNLGLGRLLLRALGRYARANGIERYRAHALASNERINQIINASHAIVVERDGPVVVYDVDIRRRQRGEGRGRRLRNLLRVLMRTGE